MTENPNNPKPKCPYCNDTGLMPLFTTAKGLPGQLPSSIVLHQTYCVCAAGRDLAIRSGATEPEGAPDNE